MSPAAERSASHGEGLAALIGPCFEGSALAASLGVTEQALVARARANEVLGLQTRDDSWVYPVWQFDEHLQVRQDVSVLLPELIEVMDPWSVGVWFTAPDEALDGLSAAQWLGSGLPVAPLIVEAVRHAERLRH